MNDHEKTAPVVERQLNDELEIYGYQCRESEQEKFFLHEYPHYWQHFPLVRKDDADSKLAELQATITELETKLNNAINLDFERRAEIERLKGGQGEPIHQVRSHGSDCWEDISGESLEMCQCQPEEYEVRKLYTSQPAPVSVSVVMSFDFEHPLSKEKRTVTLTKQNVFDGMEDYFYEKLGEQICQCESVGETNVVDCNCDEYVHDFEIVSGCLDAVAALNTTRPSHANAPADSGTHPHNDGLDDYRGKP
jgi:hypothetical protein